MSTSDCQTPGLLMLCAIFIFGLCLPGHAEPLRIVVAGDGRADFPWNDPRPGDKEGINEEVTKQIAVAMARENPQLVLWTGDIVNVNERDGPKPADKTNVLRKGLERWRQIMAPLYAHATILPVRGNHEVGWYKKNDRNPYEIANAAAIWKELMWEKASEVLANGPDCEQGTSFWYATGSVLCIGLDQYENRRHLINQRWLDDVVAKNKNELKKPFVFAYGHEPAFVTGGDHTREETLAAYPHDRDQMWKSLEDAGARIYFCGHDHFYDHMKVQRQWTPIGAEMHQLTAGTAGAPFYTRKSGYPSDEEWQLELVKHSDFVSGYILVVIEENTAPKEDTATIEFKARQPDGQYQAIDHFSYSIKVP